MDIVEAYGELMSQWFGQLQKNQLHLGKQLTVRSNTYEDAELKALLEEDWFQKQEAQLHKSESTDNFTSFEVVSSDQKDKFGSIGT